MTSTWMLVAYLLAHVGLGFVLNQLSFLVFIHAVVTILVALRLAGTIPPERVAPVLAYVTGCEVLWRMTTDRLPWELGKYAVILVCGVAIVRARGVRALVPPLMFFSLLLPSAVLTLTDFTAGEARQQLSFNLSGPLALAMSAAFFLVTRPSFADLERMLLALVGPAVSIATLALFGILTNPDITFNTESNFSTSGGFGPNQVSSMLGLGALAAFYVLFTTDRWPTRLIAFAVMNWLAVQSALTFSRGGLFSATGAALVSLLLFLRDRRMRLWVAPVAILVVLLGRYVAWPRLDEFTGGTITARFAESDLTRRDDLGAEDLTAWNEHPVFGVGPGRSSLVHDESIIAHTEFTRLLAEHGSFGAAAIALLLFAAVQNIRRAGSPRAMGLAAGMMTWACLFMLNSAMRTAAPSFVFGLAFAAIGPADRLARFAEPPQRPLRIPGPMPVRRLWAGADQHQG
jgi:hypothetical protein